LKGMFRERRAINWGIM